MTKKLFGTFASLLFVACADIGSSSSSLSGQHDGGAQSGDCTLTQGYWKNHEAAWPVSSLTLGNASYSKAELLAILRTPVKGNGLISLAHQLIAAKLNIEAGAAEVSISASIDAADDLIGNLVVGVDKIPTKDVSDLVGKLDAFNNGDTGPGHCDDAPNPPPSCDNDTDGDGDCDGEEPPSCDHDTDGDGTCDPVAVCGNGTVETGEACDDGNVTNLDGCSASCQIEVPVCGNGIHEAGEECDDGNLVSGDGCSSSCYCDCPSGH